MFVQLLGFFFLLINRKSTLVNGKKGWHLLKIEVTNYIHNNDTISTNASLNSNSCWRNIFQHFIKQMLISLKSNSCWKNIFQNFIVKENENVIVNLFVN